MDVGSDTYALDGKNGTLLWKQAVRVNLITENVVYGTSWDGIWGGLKAVDAQSGEVLWYLERQIRYFVQKQRPMHIRRRLQNTRLPLLNPHVST